MKSLLIVRHVVPQIAAVLLLLTAGCSKSQPPEAAAETTPVAPEKSSAPDAPAAPSPEKLAIATTTAPLPKETSELDPAIAAMLETNTVGVIEQRIFMVTNSDFTSVQKVKTLFIMFEGLERQDQRKVAHAAVKYTEDSTYSLVRDHLMDPNLHPQVLSVFMTDTLKRPNSVKLPVLLDLARFDGHPMQSEAQQLMRLYCGKDYGTDWSRWEQAMVAWLDKNPN